MDQHLVHQIKVVVVAELAVIYVQKLTLMEIHLTQQQLEQEQQQLLLVLIMLQAEQHLHLVLLVHQFQQQQLVVEQEKVEHHPSHVEFQVDQVVVDKIMKVE